jgi:hypothetical protein
MERHANSLTSRIARDPTSRRCLQTVVCLGALVCAGALTLETRISAASVRPSILGPALLRVANIGPSAAPPKDAAAIEAQARATAQKALAEALSRAKTRSAQGAKPTPAIKAPPTPAALLAATSADAQPRRNLSDADLRLLADKAADALKAGDIGGARMVLDRAAAAGDPTAVFALAETYDPNVLVKMHVRGLEGDVGRAKELYIQASEEGVTRARDRLDELSTANTASAE